LACRPRAWTKTEALALVDGDPLPALGEAKAYLLSAFEPVPRSGTPERDQWRAALMERLNPIAAKIAPGMSVAQGEAWRDAMVSALSNLPAMIALTAAKRAIHRPMSFISEPEAVIREIAVEVENERKDAIRRLEWLMRDLELSRRPVLANPDDGEVSPEETQAAIDKVRDPDLKRLLRDIASRSGFIPDQAGDSAEA